MRISRRLLVLFGAVLLVTAVTGRAKAATHTVADAGTRLSVLIDTPVVTCSSDGSGAEVTASYTVVSTGSADSAVMTATIGGTTYPLPLIDNGCGGLGWTCSGSTKTATGTFDMTLPNGSYTLMICATQSGAQGRTPKTACSSLSVTVNCVSTDPCANAGPFGEVPANKNLCSANGNIEIQFRGSFGEVASLNISGPGTNLTVDVNRAGDSCNYHYNWDPAGNQQAGTYIFTVNGSLTFSADLVCDATHGH